MIAGLTPGGNQANVGVAQLVEWRSPKPQAVGSSPTTLARISWLFSD